MVRQFSLSSDHSDGLGRLSRASSSSSRSSTGANNTMCSNMTAGSTMPLPQFAKFIPLRLSVEERALLNVLEQTLHVSEYTDHVDVTSARRGIKSRRILDGILETCHIATGLAVASGHERSLLADAVGGHIGSAAEQTSSRRSSMRRSGKNGRANKKKRGSPEDDTTTSSTTHRPSNGKSWASKDPKENAALFCAMFEVGRRNKVLNPSSMRTTYGKLMVSSKCNCSLSVQWFLREITEDALITESSSFISHVHAHA